MVKCVRVRGCRDGLENASLGLEDLTGLELDLTKEVESYSDQAAENY
jgi:hypothetical protein